MQKTILMIAAVALVGCGESKEEKAAAEAKEQSKSVEIADPIIENAIFAELKMSGGSLFIKSDAVPKGELTKADLEKVTVLYLGGYGVTDLKGLENLTQLTYLELAANNLTKLTKGLENLTQLRLLDLSSNQLTSVKGLEKLTQLEKLFLPFNQLTDVKGLEKLTQLESLALGNNQLTDVKGLEKLTKLTMLSLGNNQLTDLKGLEKLTQLTSLSLGNNPALTKAQIDELQKALPKCKIKSDY